MSAGTGFSAAWQQFYGASAYMTSIFKLWTLPPIIVAYGSSAISAAGAIAARPAISSHPTSIGTGTVSAQPYVIQRSKALASGIGQSVPDAIIPAHPMTKHGRGRMFATPYITPAPIALIRGAGILLPHDFFLGKSQRSISWNTRSQVSPTITPYWMTIQRVITKKGFSWNIVKTPTAKLQGQGSVAARFAPQATLTGSGTVKPVLTHVTKLVGISWNTRQKVTSSLALSWNTAGHIKTSKRVTWNTLVHIDPGVHFTWNTNALAVTSQQGLSWKDLVKVTTSQSCHWNTHGLVKTSKPALWNTEKTINSTKAISWNTRVKVSPLLHVSYNTTGRLHSSQVLKWSLVETALLAGTSHIKLAQHLSVAKSIHWNTTERIHTSQAIGWNDLHKVSAFSRFTWNMQGHLIKDLIVKWNTCTGPIRTKLPVSWYIYAPDIVLPAVPMYLGSSSIAGTGQATSVGIYSIVFYATATLAGRATCIAALEYRIFPFTNGPATVTSYTGDFLAGLVAQVTTGGMWLAGYWWWVPNNGQTGAQVFALWSVATSYTLIAGSTTTSGTFIAGQWNYVALNPPIGLSNGVPYIASTGYVSTTGFSFTQNQFGAGDPYSAGITNGPLSAYSDESGSAPIGPPSNAAQGLFGTASADPTTQFPYEGASSSNFWIDLQVSNTPPAGASYRLWPNLPIPPNMIQDTASNFTLGTEFILSINSTLNNIWYYSPPGVTQLPTACAIWVVSTQTIVPGSLNNSPVWSGAAGSGWVKCSFTSLTLLPGDYKVSVFNGAAIPSYWNNATLNYWSTGQGSNGIRNGPLYAPNNTNATSPGQDTYNLGTTLTYPGTTFSASNYWVDVEVTPSNVVPGVAILSSTGTTVAAFTLPGFCVTSAAQGACGPYIYDLVQNNNGNNVFVGNDVWNPQPGWQQTLYAHDPGYWFVVCNMLAGNTAVISYPNTGVYFNEAPLANYASMYSTYSDNVNINVNAGSIAEAAYDMWFNAYADEIMIQVDFIGDAARPRCDAANDVITTVAFGGSNGVPLLNWNLCVFGAEKIWQLATGVNIPAMKVDILSMVLWLQTHGYMVSNNSTITVISFGVEVCSTGGIDENFAVNGFSLSYTSNIQATTTISGGAILNTQQIGQNYSAFLPATRGPDSATAYRGSTLISGIIFEGTTSGMWLEGYKLWVCPSGQNTTPVKCALWSVTGLGTGQVITGSVVTSGTLTAGSWNYIPLAAPIQLAIGAPYLAAIGINGPFPNTPNYFGAGDPYSGGIVNGPLTAYSDASGTLPPPHNYGQGCVTASGSDPSVTMPLPGGPNNYWIDVRLSAGIPSGFSYSGSWRLWPNMWDALGAATDSPVNYVVGTEVHFSRTVTLNKIWYYSIGGTAELATACNVWSVSTQASVAGSNSPSWSGAAGSGWVSCSFTGVTLPAGAYRVSVYNGAAVPDAWSAKLLNYWDVGIGQNGIIEGPLSAPNLANASSANIFGGPGSEPGQSIFAVGPPNQYPNLYVDGLAQNYWVDIEVT
jgi:hypothetical protein